MAGTQSPNTSAGHRFGYGLGQMVKRVSAAWAGVEYRLVQRAGKLGPALQLLFLASKVLIGVGVVIAALYIAYWCAIIAALVVLGLYGITPERGYRNGPDGWGFYVGSTKLHN